LPPDAAVNASPFLDAVVASVSWQNRVSQFLNVGLMGGVYLAGRVRLTANILLPTSALTDDYSSSDYGGYDGGTGYYSRQPTKAASLFYGLGVGIVAVSSPNFVMSPGLAFSRTDVSEYGSSLAAAFPFEWVTANGLRLGLEFDAGRAFGGKNHLECVSSVGVGSDTCASGATLIQDRPTGTSILLQFQLGFGFNHPDPLPPEPSQNPVPYGWPAPPPPPAPPLPAAPAAAPAPLPG
jgi:hypothetical protein